MKSDNTKQIDIKFFLIPFFILFLLFAAITYFSINRHIKDTYETIEDSSLAVADSYVRRIINSNNATDIINQQIEEKLLIVSKAVLASDELKSEANLAAIAKHYYVDEINLFSPEGEVINSTNKELIGLIVGENHPVYKFMTSNNVTYVEKIRENVFTGVSYKYAYVKGKDSCFVQIGVLADGITAFLEQFRLSKLIDDLMLEENIESIFFTDNDFKLVASSSDEYENFVFDGDTIHEHFFLNEAKVGREFIDGTSKLHVCAPVFYNYSKIGTFTIVWNSDSFDKGIKIIIIDNLVRFIFISLVFGAVIYYAYRKNKSYLEVAYYDGLTKLPNMNYLVDYLKPRIKDSNEGNTAFLLLGCSNFQLINLTYGFEYGNNILRQVTQLFQGGLTGSQKLFRLTGSQFAIVVNDYKSADDLTNFAHNLMLRCKNPYFDIHKHEYLNLKIAAYVLDDENLTPNQVIHNASLGFAIIKNVPGENFIIYNRQMKENLIIEEIIEKTLIAGINNEISNFVTMHYQPLLDLKTNRILGFEALARLTIDGLGPIPPLEFIELAENRNLIFSLGNILIKETNKFLQTLKASGFNDINISVNISRLQLLRDEFIDSIKNKLEIPAEDLKRYVFEITETTLIEDFELINDKLIQLKELGISIALDDFGTGFSSLTDLSNMDLTYLKIDKSFTDRIAAISNEQLIIQDIITMSHRLGIEVIAEGVEEEYQLDYLKNHNCDIIQGYLISRPLCEEDALKFLKDYHRYDL